MSKLEDRAEKKQNTMQTRKYFLKKLKQRFMEDRMRDIF